MSLIEAGYYKAAAVPITTPDGDTYVQFGESKTGKPQVVVNFEILEGPDAGRRIAWFGYFTEKTVQRTVESLRYCGFKGDDLAGAVTQVLDQEVQIVVAHEEYDGKVTARVNWVNRAGGDGFRMEKTMGRTALTQFAAQLRNAVRQVPEAGGRKAERNGKPAGGPPEAGDQRPPADDEIPF
jgi:hypothetical protein